MLWKESVPGPRSWVRPRLERSTGVSLDRGGLVGGAAITGGIAAGVAEWGQHKLAKAVAPEWTRKMEGELAEGEKEHKWMSAAGSVLGQLPSAEMEVPKLATLPFRAALGTGMGAVYPMVTQQRLPTGPELASGLAYGVLYGKSRFGSAEAPRPPASQEARAEREQSLLDQSASSGKKWNIVEGNLPGVNPTDVAHTDPKTGDVTVSRKNLHEWMEQDVPANADPHKAITNLINHETISRRHSR